MIRRWACIVALSVSFSTFALAQEAGTGQAAGDLSRQATDPTASLMVFSLVNDFRTSFHGLDDSGYEVRFQPVIPFQAFGVSNILRVIAPFQVNGPGEEGLKTVSIYNLLVFPTSWGRLRGAQEPATTQEAKWFLTLFFRLGQLLDQFRSAATQCCTHATLATARTVLHSRS